MAKRKAAKNTKKLDKHAGRYCYGLDKPPNPAKVKVDDTTDINGFICASYSNDLCAHGNPPTEVKLLVKPGTVSVPTSPAAGNVDATITGSDWFHLEVPGATCSHSPFPVQWPANTLCIWRRYHCSGGAWVNQGVGFLGKCSIGKTDCDARFAKKRKAAKKPKGK